MNKEVEQKLLQEAKKYINDGRTLDLFKGELGWQPWMEEYTESEEGEEIAETEGKEIDREIEKIWAKAIEEVMKDLEKIVAGIIWKLKKQKTC